MLPPPAPQSRVPRNVPPSIIAMKLPSRPTVLSQTLTLAAAAALTLAGCGESTPQRIDADGTVSGPDGKGTDQAGGEAIQGRSFWETDEGSDVEEAPVDDGSLGDPEVAGADGDPGTMDDIPMDERPLPGPGSGMPTFVDPNLAAGLREDPGKTAAGTIDGLITFGDLSLLGADIDELLDYIYKPDTERAKRFKFPEQVIAAAGDDKAIVGYMIALEYKPRTNDVISFMLVRDLQSCCFGGVPRPDEWVMVEMEEGKSTEYFMYVPVTVRGKFTPGRVEDEYGYASAIYNLEASSVTRYEAPSDKKE